MITHTWVFIRLAIPGRRLDDVIKGDDLFSIIIILSNFRQLKLRENMSENTEPTYNQPKLCANGCGFYGSVACVLSLCVIIQEPHNQYVLF